MKFKEYLEERAILHDNSFANKVIKNFNSIIDNVIEDKDEKEFVKNDVVHKIVNYYNKKYGDSNGVYFSAFKKNYSIYFGIINGHAIIDDGYIVIDLQVDDMTEILNYYIEDKKDIQWTSFLKNLREVILHEIVHLEQSSKRPKGIENDQFNKLKKRYGDMMYYNKKDEIMAHAGGVVRQLENNGYKKEKIKEMIKNPGRYENILRVKSDSYETFYDALAKNNPKIWKRFLKYIWQYIEEADDEI